MRWTRITRTAAAIAVVATSAGTAVTGAAAAAGAEPGPVPDNARPLTITPASAPVGATVRVQGSGCAPDGGEVRLMLAGAGADAGVALLRGPVGERPDGTFDVMVSVPAELIDFRGRGAGPVVPGRYLFVATPGCAGALTVTPTSPEGLEVSPAGGPAGTVHTVSGEHCGGRAVRVHGLANGQPWPGEQRVEVSADGSWHGTLTVPAGLAAGTRWTVAATCETGGGDVDYLGYTYPVPANPPASPTVAVRAQPHFTG
jgi:hypothetical protein